MTNKIKISRRGIVMKEKRRRVDKSGGMHIGRGFACKYFLMSCTADGIITLKPDYDKKEIDLNG